MSSFSDLNLSQELLDSLTEMGFETPTSIQEQAIPELLKGFRDFIGLAQTGTGKTAAFGLPLLELLDEEFNYTQAVVLSPTRELCMQIGEQMRAFGKHLPHLHIMEVYGGTNIVNQLKSLKRKTPHLLVATPGRLRDLISRKAVNLNEVGVVVLDEADEMLNMGFREEIDDILQYTPEEKCTWLFSATMPKEIRRIIDTYMEEPFEVEVEREIKVNENIEHRFAKVKESDKADALCRFVDDHHDLYGVVFCRTRRDTQRLAEDLSSRGYGADALHGDLSQQQRTLVMKRFKARQVTLLVCTDVAARGIDVNDLTHVFHYALPDDQEYYTHRSGRTARAGKKGISLALVNGKEMSRVKSLQKMLNIEFIETDIPSGEAIVGNKVEQWAQRIVDEEVMEIEPELIERANQTLEGMDRETLIHKLLTRELKALNYGDDSRDLNATFREDRGGRDRDRGRGRDGRKSGGRGSKSSDGFHRFFINLGRVDEVYKGDLVKFICEETGLKGNQIGDIKLFDKHSTFEVDHRVSSKVSGQFNDMLVNGRPLRVNRDDDGDRGDRGGRGKKPFKKSFDKRGKGGGFKGKGGRRR